MHFLFMYHLIYSLIIQNIIRIFDTMSPVTTTGRHGGVGLGCRSLHTQVISSTNHHQDISSTRQFILRRLCHNSLSLSLSQHSNHISSSHSPSVCGYEITCNLSFSLPTLITVGKGRRVRLTQKGRKDPTWVKVWVVREWHTTNTSLGTLSVQTTAPFTTPTLR